MLGSINHPFLTRFVAVLVSVMITSVSAHAKTFNVKAGKAKALTAISQYDSGSCGSMPPPKYKITQTSHGKLSVVSHKIKLPKGPCAGRTIRFLFLVYAPNRGFKGQDRGSISYSKPQFTDSTIMSQTRLDVRLNVK